MKKDILLNEKGTLTFILINIVIILLSSVLSVFFSDISVIIYVALIPILSVSLGILIQFQNRNVFILSVITNVILGVLMYLTRGFEILVYLIFYITITNLSYLLTAIIRNIMNEFIE